MNKEQKVERVAEIATAIKESEAVFAVDYRGISVPQAAELRTKLLEAGARFSIVKNTLTERAADDAGAASLKEFLEGPTAFTFVPAEGGDVALAAKAISQFRRANDVLEFKGGLMNGDPLSIDQIEAIAKLPAVEVLHGQMVGVLASPITGLVRGLNQLIAGLAIALGQIQAEGKVGGDAPAGEPAAEAEAAPAAEEPAAEAEEAPAAEEPAAEAEEAPAAEAEEASAEEPAVEEETPAEPEPEPEPAEEPEAEASTETDTDDTPSEGGNEEEG